MTYFGGRLMDIGGRFIGFALGLVVCLAILALVIVGIVALVRYIHVTGNAHPAGTPGADPALRILNERYARGEITDEEYKAKKAEILK